MAIAGALILGLSAHGLPANAAAEDVDGQFAEETRRTKSLFRSVLEAELELVKRTCGSLAPDARRQIVVAGDEAVTSTARQFVAWDRGKRTTRFQPRESIHEAVATAVAPHAAPEEFAAYGREHLARLARRERAARLFIVARLDQKLGLTAAQRGAIVADLEDRWEPGWGLPDDGGDGVFASNGLVPAPDFAAACIAPHLDDRQRAVWTKWCERAGSGMFQGQGWHGWVLNGSSLEPDPWWAP